MEFIWSPIKLAIAISVRLLLRILTAGAYSRGVVLNYRDAPRSIVVRRMSLFVFIPPLMLLGSCIRPRSAAPALTLQVGDLLFQDLDSGPLCDAIEQVTFGYQGAKFTHVGVVMGSACTEQSNCQSDSGFEKWCVLEALSDGVVVTPLGSFLDRVQDKHGHPEVAVGRLRPVYRRLIQPAIQYGRSLKGRPYDPLFKTGDEAYYCSELIYAIFAHANKERPFFQLQPMTFKTAGTGQISRVWEEYFHQLGVDVPEGEPGINPGAISRSPKITIVHMHSKALSQSLR